MKRKRGLRIVIVFFLFWCITLVASASQVGPKKALTFQDMMEFKEIHNPLISEDGAWIAYNAQPDRGDGEVKVHSLKEGKMFAVERGSNPSISKNSRWVAMTLKPKAVEVEKAEKEKPKQGMALLDTLKGEVIQFEKVERFAFSDDSSFLAYHHFKEEEKEKKEEKGQQVQKEKSKPEAEESKKKKKAGSSLVLRHLESGKEIQVAYVLYFSFDSQSKYLACACLLYTSDAADE